MGNGRQLIVQQCVTVDNIAAEEDGGLSFVSGEPFSEKTDPAFKNAVMGFINSVDTMLLGANTYAQSVDYCPTADDQGGRVRRKAQQTCPRPSPHPRWMRRPGERHPPRP
jgi:hypothetical protein